MHNLRTDTTSTCLKKVNILHVLKLQTLTSEVLKDFGKDHMPNIIRFINNRNYYIHILQGTKIRSQHIVVVELSIFQYHLYI